MAATIFNLLQELVIPIFVVKNLSKIHITRFESLRFIICAHAGCLIVEPVE